MRSAPDDSELLNWMISRGARLSWSKDSEVCNVWLPAEFDGTEERPAEGWPQKCHYDPREAIRAAMKVA